jgi:hypothetical protein
MGHLTPGPPMGQAQSTTSGGTAGSDDDIIPTAIVIKNIPFNVKRETLLDIIVSCLATVAHSVLIIPPLVPF